MTDNNMARLAVTDSDSAFIIDPKTKAIIGAPEKNILAQHANKSERFSFYISTSIVEGHDLSTCNSIMVHYDNIEEKTLLKSSGIYSVQDFAVAKDGSASFSWLLDPDATVYVGGLIFSIHFANIADDGAVVYDFPTLSYSKITVGSTVWNSETIAKQYPDILAGFDARINALESGGAGGGGGSANAVLYTEQPLTEEQKAQARENIGAMAAPVGKFVNLNIEIQTGFYDNATFYDNANYRCTRVECSPGERYRVSTTHYSSNAWPVAWIYNAGKAEVGTATGEPEIGNGVKLYADCEFTIPDGGSFFCINCWHTGIIQVEKYEVADPTKAVLYTQQSLDEKQKAQARENIGAAPAEVGEYVVQNVEVLGGLYDGGTRYDNASYKCARVDCSAGDKYKVSTAHYTNNNWPVAWLYSESKQLLGTAEAEPIIDTLYNCKRFTDCEFTIPDGCSFFCVNCVKSGSFEIVVNKYEVKRFDTKPLYGKNAIYLGDSITYINDGWRPEFNALTGVNEVLCTAVSGAHLCDYEDTVVDGLDYTNGSKNTVSNQVQSIINDPPAEHIDLIIIAAGTNDHAQSAEFQGGVTQFVDENSAYIDVDTVDRTRYDGAMRWIAEKLWGLFPDAVIFFATPIQGAETSRQTWIQILKSDYMQEIATYLGTPVIDATRKSGIYGRYETTNAEGKYLYDGLHPNSAGRAKLGRCYAAEVLNYFSYLQS